ncbi:hypothetical protein ACQ7DA_11485 [Zafaria sp. J156]|uniref:hypothetical protein n=1 Tax=Zafaria sp. J156 TaxID=3116490 RepID=UPI002E78826D|nr:hypothetical protein [Zafaria sp. J156]MEE1621777.1 hypothetical protein [Zafaria sp. J156]
MNELEWNRSLPDMLERAAQIAASVPDKVTARAHLYRTVVVIDVEGPRLGAFALVLAEEAPEIVYDDQYVRFQTVPEGVDELLVFAQESIEKIVEFLLSERSPVERTSRILRRTYGSIPIDDGTSWRLKQPSQKNEAARRVSRRWRHDFLAANGGRQNLLAIGWHADRSRAPASRLWTKVAPVGGPPVNSVRKSPCQLLRVREPGAGRSGAFLCPAPPEPGPGRPLTHARGRIPCQQS